MQQEKLPYTLGLDIGIASVGWCVLGENRIIDLGVRVFDKAETAKEGDPLNLIRRTARLMRRRLRRRAWRLTKLTRLLKRHGLIEDAGFFQPQRPFQGSLWRLRVEGLDRRLDNEEWARVIYHLCKHRGFHWISRAEEKKAEEDKKGEGGKVKQGLAGTAKLMREKGYRSAAEMVLAEFPDAQRNKHGDYGKALSRILLGDELALLFKRQRELGNPHADPALETALLGNGDRKSGLFWAQKPALSGQDLLKMLGKCTFEKGEYRAPKASFTAERHVWLTRLNNLRIVVDGTTRPLNEQERRTVLPLPYKQAGDFTYKQLRAALVKAGLLPESFRFAGLSYPTGAQQAEGKAKEPETEKLVKLPAWQELRKTLKDKGLETEWESMAGAAAGGQPELLDEIARVLSVYKDDEEVAAVLRRLTLPGGERMVEALLDIRFDKFHALSLKALRKIVPHMETGLRYDEACEKAGYHHSQLHEAGKGDQQYLPPLYSGRDKDGRLVFREDLDVPRNPVVLRAINQARKVLNAVVRRHGSPAAVHIEMARDLSRPFDERNKIKKDQDEFRARNERDKAEFAAQFRISGTPKGGDFEKWRLYREQQGKCAYSVEPIDIDRLLEPGYVEVDHALPYSRSFDDSKNNKVLVLAKENRDKGNRTPYEYLDGAGNSPRWQQYVAFVESNKAYRLAKRTRLLRKDFGAKAAEEFRERNLNDTRYVCRFFKNYVERCLKLDADSAAKRCVVASGQLTAFLRARWGLIKVRSENDRHHALDAAVVAACSHGMVKRLADYARRRELEKVREGFVDAETGEIVNPAMFQQLKQHFPEPWPHFREELEARLKIDDPALLRNQMALLGTYPEEVLAALRPLFVSRAPQRRNGGAAHKDTIYGQPDRLKAQGGVTQKVPLTSLTLKDMDKLIDPQRNENLYAAIRARLDAHGGKGEKAFLADNPLRKPDREGNPTGPIVRSVTIVIDKLSGIPVRGGIAKNDSMLRVDVFRHRKDGKYHLVPVYVHHAVAKELPNRAVVAFKDEAEWTLIDGNFDFCFALYPNDLVRVTLKKESHTGYYASCNRSTGAINLWVHDRNQQVGKDGFIEGIGVKTAVAVEKFHVDVLGNIYPAPMETRRGLA
ncbi:MAG: CRISPR-associated endonuclease Cas9 [Rhodocyclaceae bacterium]|jgi:CRISPR-associated endonuclease Csn1|uniref:CRISPR-associated endonuclease Cas9 n=1 Tax=Candidatus Desulfobacillus denitrificans TaxID=2608985 RepID=A0A809R0Q7_9PROT|nr:type II CRISPR RNA-guided endonuclease Cas9 [Rhodocyclaceae bacterium]BBO21220.1 type II CRISPR RNA-guided endonuclease Cas9 [Candidatus Desulfobacillus denitrificans]GIK45870.1 MAG: CRISPR-associated endonuclease Cas9 [Betaproteobacteria bacterium]GJQ53433.1 MAG: CRISPR-associated endonuclease Cas9 [Rhodocyclaceae bacterium]